MLVIDQQHEHHQYSHSHDDAVFSSSARYPRPSSSSRRRSAAIPMTRDSLHTRTSERQMAAERAAEADFQDYVFFSRVVEGMSRQNSLLEDGSYLKSTNESLISNLVQSRMIDDHQEQDREQPNLYYRTKSSSLYESFQHIVTPVTDTTASTGPTTRRGTTATTRTAVAVSDVERTTTTHYDAATSFSVHHTTPQEAAGGFAYYDEDNHYHHNDDADDDDDDAGIFDLEL